MKSRFIFLTFILFLTFCRTLSQTDRLQIEIITLEEGVSNTLVWCIDQDRAGFLWYGTMYGLIKYDGYVFTTYRHNPADSTSLLNDDIISICEDRKGNLWAGTCGGGLNKLDRTTGQFTRYLHNTSDSTTISDDMVWVVLEDREGFIWVGTERGGLNRLDPTTQRFNHYRARRGNHKTITGGAVVALCEDRTGTLWVGTRSGLNKFNRDENTFRRFRFDTTTISRRPENIVNDIVEDSNGILWIGTGNGVNLFSPESERVVQSFGHNPEQPNSLVNPVVNRILEHRDGTFWIGTQQGLSWYNPTTSSFTNLLSDPTGLPSNNVVSLLQDNSGIVWVGAYEGGLAKLTFSAKWFEYIPTIVSRQQQAAGSVRLDES